MSSEPRGFPGAGRLINWSQGEHLYERWDRPGHRSMTDNDDPGPSPTIIVSDDQPIPIDSEALSRALAHGCSMLGADGDSSLSLTLVDPRTMAERKLEALGVDAPTDVLSYPIDGFSSTEPGPSLIGDLVLCPAVAMRQAAALGTEPDHEVIELLAHGLLHLAGDDHADADAEVRMASRQRELADAMRSGPR